MSSVVRITRAELRQLIEDADAPRRVNRVELRRSGRPRYIGGHKDPTAKNAPIITGDEDDASDINSAETQTPVRDVPVIRAPVKRSGFVSKPAPGSEPYTKQELSKGEDVSVKQPGVIDRLKNMFLGKGSAQQTPDGYRQPPTHWPAAKKAEFHDNAVKSLQATFNKYRSMYQSAEASYDVERSRHFKKQMQRVHPVLRAHQEALRSLR